MTVHSSEITSPNGAGGLLAQRTDPRLSKTQLVGIFFINKEIMVTCWKLSWLFVLKVITLPECMYDIVHLSSRIKQSLKTC